MPRQALNGPGMQPKRKRSRHEKPLDEWTVKDNLLHLVEQMGIAATIVLTFLGIVVVTAIIRAIFGGH